jgi:hypothetical protein
MSASLNTSCRRLVCFLTHLNTNDVGKSQRVPSDLMEILGDRHRHVLARRKLQAAGAPGTQPQNRPRPIQARCRHNNAQMGNEPLQARERIRVRESSMTRGQIERGEIRRPPQEFVAQVDQRALLVHDRVRQVDVDDQALDGGPDGLEDPAPDLEPAADRAPVLVDEEGAAAEGVVQVRLHAQRDVVCLSVGSSIRGSL